MLQSSQLLISGGMKPINFSAKSKKERDGINPSLIKLGFAGALQENCSSPADCRREKLRDHSRRIGCESKTRAEIHGGSSVEFDKEREEIELGEELTPKHVAVMMDGSRRWAKSRGFSNVLGYRAATEAIIKLVPTFKSYGVKVLSMFAFSIGNWARPKEEVDFIWSLSEVYASHIHDFVTKDDIRVSYVGNKSELALPLQEMMHITEEMSRDNKGMHLVLVLNYNGRYDITQATKKICGKVKDGIMQVEDINDAVFEQHLVTNVVDDFPNPDLFIRTSGDSRIGNYMLWQLAYTELYFCNKLSPDFDKEDLLEAIATFQKRRRRFGGVKRG